MTGGSQSIAAHTAIIFFFISGLSMRGKSHNDISRTDIGIVDNICTFHAACHCTVYDNSADEITYIGCFTSGGIYAYSHFTKFGQQFVCSVNDGGNYFSGDKQLVTSDSRGYKNIVNGTHTKQVVYVHDQCILCNTLPNGEISRFFPIHIGQARFGSCTISMHDITIFGVPTQNIRDYFTECLWKNSFVDVLDGIVHIFF